MDRRYYRQYEDFNTVIPNVNDFPILDGNKKCNEKPTIKREVNINQLKTDDLILLGILVLMLFSKEKDFSAIISIVFLLISEYIF